MIGSTHINDLRTTLAHAKDGLSHEKGTIQSLYPLKDSFSPEEYAFAYMQAERLGLGVINKSLTEIAWLPMQLDPTTEILSGNKAAMKNWLAQKTAKKSSNRTPDSNEFGNDLMHALARCGLQKGLDHPEFAALSLRIAHLFRDLSCLIGLLYYCTWLAENNIVSVQISAPHDLHRTAEEIAALLQSPEIYPQLRAKEQDDSRNNTTKNRALARPVDPPKKARPVLRVIRNEHYGDPFMPDTVPV